MILNIKNENDLFNEILEQVRDGIVVKEREKITFSSNQNAYLLEAAGSGAITIVSITSIEGVRNDGFYAHPTDTFNSIDPWEEDTDFVLSGSSPTTAPSYAGVIAGDTLYDYLVWQGSDKPEDGSSFYISYKYFDENKAINPKRPISFSPGSIGKAYANSFANLVGNMYNELQNSHQQNKLPTATGEDLILWGEIYEVDIRTATPSTGFVQVINNTGGDLDVTTSNRFATAGFNKVIFIPTQSKTIGDGQTDVVTVESSETGYDQNVGINTIIVLFESSDLSTQVSNVTISNPGTVAGNSNLFNDGANVESNNAYRDRIQLAINKRGTATKSAIAGAVQSLASIRQAKVFDFEDKKSIDKPNIHVFVVGEADKIVKDPAILSDVGLEVQEVKSAGIQYVTVVPMGIYVDISGSVYVDRAFATQASIIATDVSTAITNHINGLNVGEDVVYSRLVEEAMKVSNVRKFEIEEKKYSEYAFHPFDQSSTWEVYASGTDDPYGQQFSKLAKGYHDVFLWEDNEVFTSSGSQISGDVTPSVFLAIQNKNGLWVRDPQYLIDWYASNGANSITINSGAGSGSSVFLTSGSSYLLFNYESFENHVIDGLRVLMSGSIGSGDSSATVEISMWSGASEPTTKIDSGTVSVVAGTNEYEIIFGSQYVFDSDTQKHWVVISGTQLEAELSGTQIHIPIENATRGAYASPLVKWYSGSTWEAIVTSEKFMEVVTLLKETDKSDIDITNIANKSEIAIINSLTLNGRIWEGDEL